MVKVNVCIGSACHLKGSYNVINALQKEVEQHNLSEVVEISAIFCLGHCTEAVSVKIDDSQVYSVSGATASKFFNEKIIPIIKK